MKASEARALVEKTFPERDWVEQLTQRVEESETPQEVLVGAAWDLLKDLIRDRAEAGKTNIMTEPFIHIPGKLYSFDQSKLMAEELCLILRGHEYQDVEWQHVDKRVVVKFKW